MRTLSRRSHRIWAAHQAAASSSEVRVLIASWSGAFGAFIELVPVIAFSR